MYLQVGAISSSGASPIVRIPASEPWMIKRALDSGAHAIMVPMCETKVASLPLTPHPSPPTSTRATIFRAVSYRSFTNTPQEQAEAIVRASKYPSRSHPTAFRGAGAMFAPASFNQTGREYLLSANTNVLICVQIETRTAVENVEAIAAVDGIDMLFVGPNDLASSMGYVAFDHAKEPEVQEATARVLRAGLGAGKYVGHFAMGAEAAAERVKQGFEFVNCGADIVAVTAWMSSEMGTLRELVAEKGGKKGSEGGS